MKRKQFGLDNPFTKVSLVYGIARREGHLMRIELITNSLLALCDSLLTITFETCVVIVVVNGLVDTISNPGPGCLRLLMLLGKEFVYSVSLQLSLTSRLCFVSLVTATCLEKGKTPNSNNTDFINNTYPILTVTKGLGIHVAIPDF